MSEWLVAVVFDDHDQHAEYKCQEYGDQGKDAAVVEPIRLRWVFGKQRALQYADLLELASRFEASALQRCKGA